MPIEHAQIIEVGAFADPDRAVQRIDGFADGDPDIDAEARVLPEEDDGLAVDLEIRRVCGVRRQQRGERTLDIIAVFEQRAARFKIDGGAEAGALRHIEQQGEIRFGLIVDAAVWPVPRLNEGVDAGLLRLTDLPLDDGAIGGGVGRDRLIAGLGGPERIGREPGVIERQH